MKKRLIDLTLDEIKLFQKKYDKTSSECENKDLSCDECRFRCVCAHRFEEIDFSQEVEVDNFELSYDEENLIITMKKLGFKYMFLEKNSKVCTFFTQEKEEESSITMNSDKPLFKSLPDDVEYEIVKLVC